MINRVAEPIAEHVAGSLERAAGRFSVLMGAVLLQACAALQPAATAPAAPAVAAAAKPVVKPLTPAGTGERREPAMTATPLTPAQQTLAAGIDAYNKGDYNAAIHKLASSDITAADKATQLTALKYAAFSYCLTKRQTLCRQQFGKAFLLDPAFELAAGERGHPLWQPAFDVAQKKSQLKK
ncbi:MAG: TssQ family T6SS-associated lipoprotein [Herminiimonas sp.]|nr:TssQ family T6SS-associated lipoprotein [Herminiimonas sp.]